MHARGFAWADGVPAVCLTFIAGLTPDQVEGLLGADQGNRRSTTFEQAAAVRVFDPVLGTSEVGDPLPEEAGAADGPPIHAALALAETLTGVRVTGAWFLDEARPTVTCLLAAP